MGGKMDWAEHQRQAAALEKEAKAREHQELVDSIRRRVELDKRADGFAALAPLPGEDPDELSHILQELRTVYEPEDAEQDDALMTMAEALFRKRHRRIFRDAARARKRWGYYFDYPDDHFGVHRVLREIGEVALKKATALCEAGDKKEEQNLSSNGTTETATPVTSAPSANNPADKKDKDPNPTNDTADRPAGLPDICVDGAVAVWMNEKADQLEAAYTAEFGEPSPTSIMSSRDLSQQILLAMTGDLATAECCSAELRLVEELDRTIDRSRKRILEMKANSKKKAAERYRDPLLPERRGRHQ